MGRHRIVSRWYIAAVVVEHLSYAPLAGMVRELMAHPRQLAALSYSGCHIPPTTYVSAVHCEERSALYMHVAAAVVVVAAHMADVVVYMCFDMEQVRCRKLALNSCVHPSDVQIDPSPDLVQCIHSLELSEPSCLRRLDICAQVGVEVVHLD